MLDHTRDRARGVAEHPARDRVDAGDVDDRRHDRDVADTDIRRRVAAGHGRDHQFGQADRQRAHRGCDEDCPAAAADSDHTENPTGLILAAQVAFEREAHRGHGLAAIRPGKRRGAASFGGMTAGNSESVDVRGHDGRLVCADVDGHNRHARGPNPFRNERQLTSLRVHRRNGVNRRIHQLTPDPILLARIQRRPTGEGSTSPKIQEHPALDYTYPVTTACVTGRDAGAIRSRNVRALCRANPTGAHG